MYIRFALLVAPVPLCCFSTYIVDVFFQCESLQRTWIDRALFAVVTSGIVYDRSCHSTTYIKQDICVTGRYPSQITQCFGQCISCNVLCRIIWIWHPWCIRLNGIINLFKKEATKYFSTDKAGIFLSPSSTCLVDIYQLARDSCRSQPS